PFPLPQSHRASKSQRCSLELLVEHRSPVAPAALPKATIVTHADHKPITGGDQFREETKLVPLAVHDVNRPRCSVQPCRRELGGFAPTQRLAVGIKEIAPAFGLFPWVQSAPRVQAHGPQGLSLKRDADRVVCKK